MPDYAKMYRRLLIAQAKAIEILQEAQQDTEDMYISSPRDNITVLETKKPDTDKPNPDK